MKTKLFIILLSILPMHAWAQTPNYEQQGDELFAQAQYEKALKKYRAAIEITGESPSLRDKIAKAEQLLQPQTSCANTGYFNTLSIRKLTDNDLRGKTADELSIMRNSIYARHGYRFKKQKYLEYFGQFDWYRPNTDNQQVAFNRMSSIEKYNVNFIREHE